MLGGDVLFVTYLPVPPFCSEALQSREIVPGLSDGISVLIDCSSAGRLGSEEQRVARSDNE